MVDDQNRDVTQSASSSEGVTPTERYLKKLCDRTFLSLWSYAGIFRDQGINAIGEGKEVCDLLVVFENHIIIFSDKDCAFPNTGNLELDWSRWFRRAVLKSAEQVWGAERWIKKYPNRLFLDRACTKLFPIDFPSTTTATFHRIVVAHDVSRVCKERFGGSGSLMIDSTLTGKKLDVHIDDEFMMPFSVGQIDPAKGFVHVLDDTSLDIVLRTLDTITDFVHYLTRKEILICNENFAVHAAGEEELLALYLSEIDNEGEHDFIFQPGLTGVAITEGHWEHFLNSPERKSQLQANQISYAWDNLIEVFNKHILSGTSHFADPPSIRNQEKLIRFLAREPRTRRRMLARSLIELIEKTPKTHKATRLIFPSKPGDPYFVLLLLPHLPTVPFEEYREVRRNLLIWCCMVVKSKFPESLDIVGIATESGRGDSGSEDAIYLDARTWTQEQQAEARSLQEELGLLRNVTRFESKEYEYPKT